MPDMHSERMLDRRFGKDADAWECLMDWIGNNWIWVLLVVGMVAMHLFGHRGHGQMSRRNEGPDRDESAKNVATTGHVHAANPQAGAAKATNDPTAVAATTPAKNHRHGC